MLELKNVSAGYGKTDVLHDISCTFTEGSCWSILGPNGCGKTTLLRVMAGLLPHSGQVLLDGQEISTRKRRELAGRVALMSQINTVYFPYTVYDAVMLGRYQHMKGSLLGSPSREDRESVERCLEYTDLSDLRSRMLNELSGGQLQRVFLARAMAQEPVTLLLDEPTNHLDIRNQVELADYLHHWCEDGKHTVIGVIHDINLALRLSRNVLIMREGRIMRKGNFSAIADSEFLYSIYGMDLLGYMREASKLWNSIG